MANEHGTFCWNELITTDVEKAKEFYTKLLGWGAEAWPGDIPYTTFKAGETQVGGLMARTPEMGEVPPHWMAYIAVDNVDDVVAKVEELGGQIYAPPTDIPDVGRFSIIADPTGAAVGLLTIKATD
jgi:predicted enzyme related to lactoylglutathione lyase